MKLEYKMGSCEVSVTPQLENKVVASLLWQKCACVATHKSLCD